MEHLIEFYGGPQDGRVARCRACHQRTVTFVRFTRCNDQGIPMIETVVYTLDHAAGRATFLSAVVA